MGKAGIRPAAAHVVIKQRARERWELQGRKGSLQKLVSEEITLVVLSADLNIGARPGLTIKLAEHGRRQMSIGARIYSPEAEQAELDAKTAREPFSRLVVGQFSTNDPLVKRLAREIKDEFHRELPLWKGRKPLK